ncbi:MAG: undecaprenyl-diphosphate phosphatase [Gammaproteobacteria bacterium]
MTTLQTILLALMQGLTEFLPISSSGHLILLPLFVGWEDQGLAFDVAVHFGTLIAVVAYFWDDVMRIARALLGAAGGGALNDDARLGLNVGIATIPVALAGLALGDFIDGNLRSAAVIATTTGVFGILLWVADRFGKRERSVNSATFTDAMIVGFAQVIALIPGTSRSGITMTAALARGFDRDGAARFSFLMSIPVIVLASGYQTLKLLSDPVGVPWMEIGLGVAVSAIAAYACIGWFMRFVARAGMWVFAVYRVLLAGLIVYFLV